MVFCLTNRSMCLHAVWLLLAHTALIAPNNDKASNEQSARYYF